jgi:hypothetical protein
LLVELKGQPAKKTPEGAGGNGQGTAVVTSGVVSLCTRERTDRRRR